MPGGDYILRLGEEDPGFGERGNFKVDGEFGDGVGKGDSVGLEGDAAVAVAASCSIFEVTLDGMADP